MKIEMTPPSTEDQVENPEVIAAQVDSQNDDTPTPSGEKASQDSAYTSLNLPSRFYFYGDDFKSISIRRFNISDIRKMFNARNARDMTTFVEGINATIDKDVMELTAGDLMYIMYWHRLNSYERSPWEMVFRCDEYCREDRDVREEREERIEEAITDHERDEIRKETEHTAIITTGNTEVKDFDQVKFEDEKKRIEEEASFQFEFDPLRVQDMVDLAARNRSKRGDLWFMNNAATLHTKYGKRVADRARWLESKARLASFDTDEFLYNTKQLTDAADHGVVEAGDLNCGRCGSTRRRTLSIDALDFFPYVQGA